MVDNFLLGNKSSPKGRGRGKRRNTKVGQKKSRFSCCRKFGWRKRRKVKWNGSSILESFYLGEEKNSLEQQSRLSHKKERNLLFSFPLLLKETNRDDSRF